MALNAQAQETKHTDNEALRKTRQNLHSMTLHDVSNTKIARTKKPWA
jgi:hypothetical protein